MSIENQPRKLCTRPKHGTYALLLFLQFVRMKNVQSISRFKMAFYVLKKNKTAVSIITILIYTLFYIQCGSCSFFFFSSFRSSSTCRSFECVYVFSFRFVFSLRCLYKTENNNVCAICCVVWICFDFWPLFCIIFYSIISLCQFRPIGWFGWCLRFELNNHKHHIETHTSNPLHVASFLQRVFFSFFLFSAPSFPYHFHSLHITAKTWTNNL